ncbi:HD-GYP domain-containing protein [Magnetococcales bacterium HHB-1]
MKPSQDQAAQEELESGDRRFDLNDPNDIEALLKGIELIDDIPNGHGGIAVPKGYQITDRLLDKLLYLNQQGIVSSVIGRPIGAKKLQVAATAMDEVFSIVEDAIKVTNGSLDDALEVIRNSQNLQEFKEIIKQNMEEALQAFSPYAMKQLQELQQHHASSGNHSILAGFNAMMIARAQGVDDQEVIRRAMAVIQHDLGKTRVKLNTLNWPGKLSTTQWKEMQLHSLFGFRILYNDEKSSSLGAFTALLHHEWYSLIPGKGYGGLTTYRAYLKKRMNVDMDQVLRSIDYQTLETIYQCMIADMVAALEEVRAYKQRLGPFKTLIIMVHDAKQGHFHPKHFKLWYDTYRTHNEDLLLKGMRVGLPREMEQHRFAEPEQIKLSRPMAIFTWSDMKKLGFTRQHITHDDAYQLRRQGGFCPQDIMRIARAAKFKLDLKQEIRNKSIPIRKHRLIIRQQQTIINVTKPWVTYDQLKQAGLLPLLRAQMFSPEVIRDQGGLSLKQLSRRTGAKRVLDKLEKYGLARGITEEVHLPTFEHRLTPSDLEKLELDKLVQDHKLPLGKFGIHIELLEQNNIRVQKEHLTRLSLPVDTKIFYTPYIFRLLGVSTECKVFYDILITEEIDLSCRAKALFLREGDDLHELRMHPPEKLDPLQTYLLKTVGEVEIDFSSALDMPDLSQIQMGAHWQPGYVHNA